MPLTAGTLTVLPAAEWRPLQEEHRARVDALTRNHRARAGGQIPHPVEDFLFTYYSLRPAQLGRWYPGVGVALADAAERLNWRFHRQLPADGAPVGGDRPHCGNPLVAVDLDAFRQTRGSQLAFTARLLGATAAAPGHFGCFGLHEWAMVFQQDDGGRRHQDWPLRLGQAGTDDVVRDHQIRCTHFDAFRFFTPQARPLNDLQPDRGSQLEMEQPGCLHASMDLYKWAYKLIPAMPSGLLVDAFVLARSIRELDMRASPYDLTELGYEPIQIETPAGKAEYVTAQRGFARQAQLLRRRLLDTVAEVLAAE